MKAEIKTHCKTTCKNKNQSVCIFSDITQKEDKKISLGFRKIQFKPVIQEDLIRFGDGNNSEPFYKNVKHLEPTNLDYEVSETLA